MGSTIDRLIHHENSNKLQGQSEKTDELGGASFARQPGQAGA
jgi:hypothetical protein